MELGSGKMPVAERDSLTNGQSTIAMEDYGATSGGRQRAEDKIRILADQDDVEMESNLYNRTTCERRLNRECYFKDGVRPIDFVLVYEEDIQTLEERKAGKIGKKKDKSLMTDKDRFELWREKFMANLAKVGLQFEEESIESAKKMIYFIKIHLPWDVLSIHGEDLMLRAPLQLQPSSDVNWSARLLNCCKLPNIMEQDVPNKPLHYYTCAFKRTKISRFLGAEKPETFFPTRDRHRVAYEILAKTVYGKKKRAEIGIDRLLEEGIYSAAYPLHDGPDEANKEQLKHPDQLNARQVLYEYWARWGCWYKYQPLDHIREYFGEKIGIYFAWLGFYTAWLLPASFVGLIVFLFGVITMDTNTAAKETCESGGKYLMCPQCDAGCPYWNLSDSCIYVQIAYLFDQPGTVFYAIFMSFWAVTFLEYWKRKTANLAYHWDCLDFQDEEERPRPEYAAKCTQYEKNPITGVREPYFPPRDRLPRILSGIGVIVMMMVLVLIFIVAVIMYRVLMIIILNQQSGQSVLKSQSNAVAGLSASVVNLIIILALGKVYEKLALKLTQWEMHRTQSEFEDQLIFKVFIFQFVNFYSSIIYIGFFKGKFVGYPGHYSHMLGLRQEECQNNSCLVELAEQLGVIMIGKQIINNAQELLVPKIKSFVHKWKIGKMEKNVHKTRWEEDYEMIDNEGLFEEYLEMVLQFGFITIFVAAFPLAPLFALLNNWMEIRLDAHKFVCETRRPVAERCQDIGVWFRILDGLAQLAVISNAFLIAFTSEFLPKQLYSYQYDSSLSGYVEYSLAWAPENSTSIECRYKDFRNRDGTHTEFYWKLLCIRLAFVILFEHVVFGVCRLIDVLVPDVPESLEIKIKREHYLAKQALADADTSLVFGGADEDETDKPQQQVT